MSHHTNDHDRAHDRILGALIGAAFGIVLVLLWALADAANGAPIPTPEIVCEHYVLPDQCAPATTGPPPADVCARYVLPECAPTNTVQPIETRPTTAPAEPIAVAPHFAG